MAQFRQSVAEQDLGKAGPINMAAFRQNVAFEDDKIWVKRGL